MSQEIDYCSFGSQKRIERLEINTGGKLQREQKSTPDFEQKHSGRGGNIPRK